MFGSNEVFGPNQAFSTDGEFEVDHASASGTSATGVPLQTTKSDRLAEFVHHLGGVPLRDARRAVHHTHPADHDPDPLAIVAAALLELRRAARQPGYIGA